MHTTDTAAAAALPRTWTDAQGREWTPRVTIALVEQLKAEGLDLLNPQQLGQVYQDPIEFLRLAGALHRSQCAERNVEPLPMLDLMTETEQTAEQSAAAVEAALLDFFRRLRGGKAMAVVIERAGDATRRTEQMQVDRLNSQKGADAIDRVVQRALLPLDEALDRVGQPGEPSGHSPAS